MAQRFRDPTKPAVWSNDFPYYVCNTPFARYSSDLIFDTRSIKRKTILVGGYMKNETTFYEILLNSNKKNGNHYNTKSISFKSFCKDYHKEKANLDCIFFGDFGARFIDSFITKDNKYLIILQYGNGLSLQFNVYNIEKDYWLLGINDIHGVKNHYFSASARTLLINDEILVISEKNILYFFAVKIAINCDDKDDKDDSGNELNININGPKARLDFISRHHLESKSCNAMTNHGICCIGYNDYSYNGNKMDMNCNENRNIYNNNEDYTNDYYGLIKMGSNVNGRKYERYGFKLVLFGGNSVDFIESFVTVDVNVNVMIKKRTNNNIQIDIKECAIDSRKIKCVNCDVSFKYNNQYRASLAGFGYDCLLNANNEAVILIIGGYVNTRGLFSLNCTKWQLTAHENVK